MTSALVLRSFSDELQKIAARRGVKMIGSMWSKAQKAFAAGDTQTGTALMERANKLSKTPGVVKPSAAGSQIQSIGRGSEGAVTAVADPQFGLSARKLYDPHGISTKELIKRKDIAGKALGRSEDVAEYYGQRATPGAAQTTQLRGGVLRRQKGQMQFSELIPQGPAPKIDPLGRHVGLPGGNTPAQRRATQGAAVSKARTDAIKQSPGYQEAKDRAAVAYKRTPYSEAQDVRASNMVLDPRTGTLKTVDAIPAKPGEFIAPKDRKHIGVLRKNENIMAPTSDEGIALTKSVGPRISTPQLKRGLLGTGSPRRGVSTQAGTAPFARTQIATPMASAVPQVGTAAARPSAMRKAKPVAPRATIPGF